MKNELLNEMNTIPAISGWDSIEPVSKGWSNDRKYRVVMKNGDTCLLRLADAFQYDAKKKEYGIIRKFSTLGFPMSEPLDFGRTTDGSKVYMLLTWVKGRDLEEVLPELSEERQYLLGREAGEILKKIHSLPLDAEDIPVKTKKEKKLLQLSRYEQSNVRVKGDETVIQYVKDHIGLIWRESPVYLHGDFHPGNLIYTSEGRIGVIDFNRWEVGDSYEEFYKLQSFGRELSIPYCVGQIDAYFENCVPEEFWKTLAVYVAHSSLYSMKWAEAFGQQEIDGMVRRYRTAFEDYEGFAAAVPKWYREADAKKTAWMKDKNGTAGE